MKKSLAILILLFLTVSANAAQDFYIKKGMTGPYYYFQITDNAGAVNLTGATVTFSMLDSSGATTTAKVNAAACVVTSAALGYAEYHWTATDTDTAGVYIVEIGVVLNGLSYIIPARDRAVVVVRDNYN